MTCLEVFGSPGTYAKHLCKHPMPVETYETALVKAVFHLAKM